MLRYDLIYRNALVLLPWTTFPSLAVQRAPSFTIGSLTAVQSDSSQMPFVAFSNLPMPVSDELKDRSFAATARRAQAVTQIACPNLSPSRWQCSVTSRPSTPAIRQSNCMVLGAGHPPIVWACKRPTTGVQIDARKAGIEPGHW